MVGYDIKSDSLAMDDCHIRKANPVFMGNFFDVLIRNGRWPTIKQLTIPNVPFPSFKIKIENKFYVETWDRQHMREATPEECTILQFRSDHGPIILENALKAYFGLEPWEPVFDTLKAETVVKLSKVI